MKFDKFQAKIKPLATYNPGPIKGQLEAEWCAEEGVETMRCFRTSVKNNEQVNQKDLKEEMGDVLVALAHLANEMGFSLDDIASDAINKQQDRFEEDQEENK